jgi:hypothetical protein
MFVLKTNALFLLNNICTIQHAKKNKIYLCKCSVAIFVFKKLILCLILYICFKN